MKPVKVEVEYNEDKNRYEIVCCVDDESSATYITDTMLNDKTVMKRFLKQVFLWRDSYYNEIYNRE